MERKAGLSFSNFSWQSKKISAKESCLYGIISIRITPFLGDGVVFSQLYYTISGEGLVAFLVTKNAVFMRLMAFCKRLNS